MNDIPSYITITYPTEGQTVKGHVVTTTDTSADINTVEFYIDGVLKKTDTAAPNQDTAAPNQDLQSGVCDIHLTFSHFSVILRIGLNQDTQNCD